MIVFGVTAYFLYHKGEVWLLHGGILSAGPSFLSGTSPLPKDKMMLPGEFLTC